MMPSAAELADVRPKPRPRQRKPPAHSSDFVQDPGTSPEDHVYEDIDKVMPPIKIPPRNVPRQVSMQILDLEITLQYSI